MTSVSIFHWSVALVVLVTMWCAAESTTSIEKERPHQLVKRTYRPRGRTRQGRPNRNGFDLTRYMQQRDRWSIYAPTPPSDDQVNCEIEVEVTERVGGRCVRLGGAYGPAVCQSGVHLDIWSGECFAILAQREAQEAATSQTDTDTDTGTGTDTDTGGDTSSATSTSQE